MENIPKQEKLYNTENKQESISSEEEVLSIFLKIIEKNEFEEIRKLEDEQGLYLWDIKVLGEDEDTEYSYIRAGRFNEGKASVTIINATFLDKKGFPVGGYSVAEYINGEWKFLS